MNPISFKIEETTLPNGNKMNLKVIRGIRSVGVIPFLNDDRIVLIHQYRPAIKEYIWEIPAGILEAGEDPAVCAARELEEETGYISKNIIKLFDIYLTPGYSDEKMNVFVARDLKNGKQQLESSEVIDVHEFSKEEVLKMIKRGEIVDGKTLASLSYGILTFS